MSLKDGKYALFEHADEHPLFVNNFGMNSKLKRFVYSDHPLPNSYFQKNRAQLNKNNGFRHIGTHGQLIYKYKGEKIPLLG